MPVSLRNSHPGAREASPALSAALPCLQPWGKAGGPGLALDQGGHRGTCYSGTAFVRIPCALVSAQPGALDGEEFPLGDVGHRGT